MRDASAEEGVVAIRGRGVPERERRPSGDFIK